MARKCVDEYGLAEKRVLLFIGRLAREKRIDRLVDAFSGVAARDDDVVLVLVGEGDERASLIRRVRELGLSERVVFAGRHDGVELAAWYQIGGVFVLCSEYEPFGAVVNEALLAGMPVVCSNKAGAKSLIRSGWNGTVVDPDNIAALQDALSYWLAQCPPVTLKNVSALRNSLMPILFQDAVDAYCGIINRVFQVNS
jgi:glycosyltransferase involved in cell wall biosynthesis